MTSLANVLSAHNVPVGKVSMKFQLLPFGNTYIPHEMKSALEKQKSRDREREREANYESERIKN